MKKKFKKSKSREMRTHTKNPKQSVENFDDFHSESFLVFFKKVRKKKKGDIVLRRKTVEYNCIWRKFGGL